MRLIYFVFFAMIFFSSCQEKFEPDYADEEPTVVVEGYIQAGDEATPVTVFLSKTYPLFQSDVIKGPELFLGGAEMRVRSGETTVELTEVCTNELDPALKAILIELLSLDSQFFENDLCFYTDLAGEINAEVGKSYVLEIDFEGKTLTAETSIPEYVPIDSIVMVNAANIDTLRQVSGYLNDPGGLNFYRIKVGLNGGVPKNPFSVTDDKLFDGQSFEFPINKQPDPSDGDVDPNTAGFYTVGDSLIVQWQTLDQSHYNFWNTLEFARGNQGPFSSYTRADSNVKGGIGIWGGSSVGYYNVVVE